MDPVTLARASALEHFRWMDGDADTWAMLADGTALAAIVAGLAQLARQHRPDVVVGIESRGFLLGPAVAAALGIGFVPVRKEGALFPGELVRQETEPDYRGNRQVLLARPELLPPGRRVVLIDDWIETGSQALAAAHLIASCRAKLVAVVVIIDEASPAARDQLPPISAVMTGADLP